MASIPISFNISNAESPKFLKNPPKFERILERLNPLKDFNNLFAFMMSFPINESRPPSESNPKLFNLLKNPPFSDASIVFL